jgi:hypothetical protein
VTAAVESEFFYTEPHANYSLDVIGKHAFLMTNQRTTRPECRHDEKTLQLVGSYCSIFNIAVFFKPRILPFSQAATIQIA